jgi:hypothetical protein
MNQAKRVSVSLLTQAPEICNLFVAPVSIRTQHFNTSINAFVADVHLWPGDETRDGVLALAAKGTVQFSLFAHGSVLGSADLQRQRHR